MKKLIVLFLLTWVSIAHAQPIPEVLIDPLITRDAEIIPTGETNAVCITNTGTPAPAIALCSTVDLTGKTLLFKLPEYTVATLPATHPLAIVTDGAGTTDCTVGSGSMRVMCHWNGSTWAAIGGGSGVGDPGSNGLAVRSALNTLIARSLATASSARIGITNADGVSGNPTLDTGSDVPLKSGANIFTAANTFNSALVIPRKATPGDLGLLSNGEVFVDGELVKYKSNTGVLYTLFKLGDPVVRSFLNSTDPTSDDDTADGYVIGDIWINNGGTDEPGDDSVWFAVSVDEGAAIWVTSGGSSTPSLQQVGDVGRILTADCSNPLKIAHPSDPTTYWKFCHDASDGLQFVPVVGGVEHASNKRIKLTDTFDFCILDNDDTCIFKLTETGVFSGSAIKKSVQLVVFDFTTDTATGDGKFYTRVPPAIDGYTMTAVSANVITAGTTGTLNVDLTRCAATTTGNVCSGTIADMLTTNLTIDSGENDSATAAAAVAINAANSLVASGEIIRVDIDAVHTTAAKGLILNMEFTAP